MAHDSDVEQAVLDRYGAGARQSEPGLCCPTRYEERYLAMLPAELLAKDYGCGDPSRHVRAGERVLDLGSGAGKICYILAQKVGRDGQVTGVDFNDDMLAVARRHQSDMAERMGYANVRFVKGRIQDLALPLEAVAAWLAEHPVTDFGSLTAFEAECRRLRDEQPLVPDASVDVVVSNCVLNLVRQQDKRQLFREIQRVLRRGGRAVISDIVCDEDPTPRILADPQLWSGCISGAFREDLFLRMFEEAGFYGIEILSRQVEPWQVLDGIEFRSMTVRAFKGTEGPCLERNQAVVYGGPWKRVVDDDGHMLHRGERMAVCDKTFGIYTDPDGPYAQQISAVEPHTEVPPDEAPPFACQVSARRDPRRTKGTDYDATVAPEGGACCEGDC